MTLHQRDTKTVWDLAKGEPVLRTEWQGTARSVQITPGGHVALLLRYDEPLLRAIVSDKDGTIAVKAVAAGGFASIRELARLEAVSKIRRLGRRAETLRPAAAPGGGVGHR